MIYETFTRNFVRYSQELRDDGGDPYKVIKTKKDRVKARQILNMYLKDREVYLTYKTGDIVTSVVATKIPSSELPQPLPAIEPVETHIGEHIELQEHHVSFYIMPACEPTLVHIDDVVQFVVTPDNIDNLFDYLKFHKDEF